MDVNDGGGEDAPWMQRIAIQMKNWGKIVKNSDRLLWWGFGGTQSNYMKNK